MSNHPIPLRIQFEAACAAVSVHNRRRVRNLLQGYGYPAWIRDHSKQLKKFLSFTSSQLYNHLKQHPELCQELFMDCGDKRYSPSTFIENQGDKYIVGLYDPESLPSNQDVLYFETIEEAVTDYVLFSLGMPRLKHDRDSLDLQHGT